MINPWDEIGRPTNDINARLLENDHPLQIYWGRNSSGDYLFICEFPEFEEYLQRMPELEGIRLALRDVDQTPRLVLELTNSNDWEIFFVLCSDLIECTRSISLPEEAPSRLFSRLLRWHEFLKRKIGRLLTEQKIIGLIGELHVLISGIVPRFGLETALNSWQGPEGAAQDFVLPGGCIEVKSRLASASNTVRISSAEQLCCELPILYLDVVTLVRCEDSADALTLPRLIAHVRGLLKEAASHLTDVFEEHLLALGYIDLPDYDQFEYTLIEETVYEVCDGFPRIQLSDVPEGISRIKYTLSLRNLDEGEINWERFDSNDH